MRRLGCALAVMVLCAIPLVGLTCRAQPAAETQMVAMADGTKLATDVYLPKRKGPFPAILLRTPYNKNGNRGTAAVVARFGYALVV